VQQNGNGFDRYRAQKINLRAQVIGTLLNLLNDSNILSPHNFHYLLINNIGPMQSH